MRTLTVAGVRCPVAGILMFLSATHLWAQTYVDSVGLYYTSVNVTPADPPPLSVRWTLSADDGRSVFWQVDDVRPYPPGRDQFFLGEFEDHGVFRDGFGDDFPAWSTAILDPAFNTMTLAFGSVQIETLPAHRWTSPLPPSYVSFWINDYRWIDPANPPKSWDGQQRQFNAKFFGQANRVVEIPEPATALLVVLSLLCGVHACPRPPAPSPQPPVARTRRSAGNTVAPG